MLVPVPKRVALVLWAFYFACSSPFFSSYSATKLLITSSHCACHITKWLLFRRRLVHVPPRVERVGESMHGRPETRIVSQ